METKNVLYASDTKNRDDRSWILPDNMQDSKYESASSEDNQEEFRLPYFQASLFASIMEEGIEKIRILCDCNNQLRLLKTKSNIDSFLLDKYGVPQPIDEDELANIDVNILDGDKYKLDKLEADRKHCINLLCTTYLDLATKKRFDALYEANSSRIQQGQQYYCLLQDEAKNKLIRRALMKQIRQQRNRIKSILYDTELNITRLKSQLEDISLISEIRGRYIDNWQTARTEQNTIDITDQEAGPSDNIKYFRSRYEHELRVHTEVELLTNIIITETFEKVESWMNKYDLDMEGVELKIQKMKIQYQTQRDKKMDMENTLETHDNEMKAWVHFKDEREKARLYVIKMTNAATAVQAWWRGLLVRLQLGPYKPAKKKGDKKGKKK